MLKTNTKNNFITVVSPFYNDHEYIDDMLMSIDHPVNLVIVDDCSLKPESLSKIESLSKNFVILRHTLNKGQAAAKNFGIKFALENYKSEIIITMDSDDLFAPYWLSSVEHIMKMPDAAGIDVLGGVCHPDKNFYDCWFPEGKFSLDRNNTCPSSATAIRKKVFDKVLFDESMRKGCEDWDFYNRCFLTGHRVSQISRSALIYRNKPATESHQLSNQQNWTENVKYMREKYVREFGIEGI